MAVAWHQRIRSLPPRRRWDPQWNNGDRAGFFQGPPPWHGDLMARCNIFVPYRSGQPMWKWQRCWVEPLTRRQGKNSLIQVVNWEPHRPKTIPVPPKKSNSFMISGGLLQFLVNFPVKNGANCHPYFLVIAGFAFSWADDRVHTGRPCEGLLGVKISTRAEVCW